MKLRTRTDGLIAMGHIAVLAVPSSYVLGNKCVAEYSPFRAESSVLHSLFINSSS